MRSENRARLAANHRVDEKYYEAARPHSLAERLAIRARDEIFSDFLRVCDPSETESVLDVGVSDVVGEAPNVIERLYPYRYRITAIGLGNSDAFQAEFPEVRYRQVTPNSPFPFADKSFDVATSNAVLEHVGSIEKQRNFVAEMMRVARRVFITVPHRFFPIEHHTGIPFLHYLDLTFGPACRLCRKDEWADAANLVLMSRARLRSAWPKEESVEIGFTGLRLGPFSSNLYAYWHQCDGG